MVVVGHVDSGKSTLVGKLLHEMKVISDKQVQRNAKEAKRLGRESFVWAWITDESKEEQERGITMDIGYRGLQLKDVYLNILDSPGHKDFVPNMINGACQADYAILVVDATSFESGFQKNGQTKEHAVLLRSLGVRRVIVAINKMDVIEWNIQKFKEIKKKMGDFLTKIDLKDVSYVGISAF